MLHFFPADFVKNRDTPSQQFNVREIKTSGFLCTPGGSRTPNPRIRSPMLCPVELRARLDVRGVGLEPTCPVGTRS